MLCVAAGWSFAFKTTSMVSGPAPIGSGTGHLRAGFSNSWWKAENAEGDGAFPEHLHPSTGCRHARKQHDPRRPLIKDKDSGRWHSFGITKAWLQCDNSHYGEDLCFHAATLSGQKEPLRRR